jgi:all-trans-nonaprenyl-diphosphate synthase
VLSDLPLERLEALYRFGRQLGLAFQVVDDILDFTGNDLQLGKPAASDLASGYLTAPALYALRERPALAGLIEREFSQEGDLEQALELVRGCEAIPRSRALAEQFAREAGEALAWLPPSEPRSALRALPDYVLSRLY